MSIQWTLPDGRAVCELAVGLDVAGRLLATARSSGQLDRAIAYNLRLWRAVRALALAKKVPCGRTDLAGTAEEVLAALVIDAGPGPDSRDVAFVAGRNLSTARELVGDRSSETALACLLAEWGGASAGTFEAWLLERIRGRAGQS